MMVCDAKWLGDVLSTFTNDEISPLLNIGSSTREFRESEQSHIHQYVFSPLEKRGIRIIHCDTKAAEGVDVVADIFDDKTIRKLKSFNPKSVICTHMLEHIKDRNDLARRLLCLLPVDGLFFITVPNSYHYHADPIDTLYRPSPEELAKLFGGQDILYKELLIGGTYRDLIRKRPVVLFFRHFFRFFVPFINLEKWKRSMKKLYWIGHNYKVSAIAGRKVTDDIR